MVSFILNDKLVNTELPPGYLLLDFIRYHAMLMGTKIGCREGDCGACTILSGEIIHDELVYSSATSCLMPIGNAAGKHIVTIEGINVDGLNAVQQAFSDTGATQCGFCTPGFIVSLTGYCINENSKAYTGAIDAMNGNICRCTGYKSIERAARIISEKLQERNESSLTYAVARNFIPGYFLEIKERLNALSSPLQNQRIHSPGKRLLGGGTDLYVQQHEEMVQAEINFISAGHSGRKIYVEGGICYAGSGVTVTDIYNFPEMKSSFPLLDRFMKLVSSTQIRNMATITGNFVNASPIGDFTIFFLALNAQLHLRNGGGTRVVALKDFYLGYKKMDLLPGEFVEMFSFPLPAENAFFNFEKLSKRTNLDIASVNTAIYLEMEGEMVKTILLSAGGVGPIPALLLKAGKYIRGKKINEQSVLEMIVIVQEEISPISDARGSELYKRRLLTQLIKAHFIQFFPQLDSRKLLAS